MGPDLLGLEAESGNEGIAAEVTPAPDAETPPVEDAQLPPADNSAVDGSAVAPGAEDGGKAKETPAAGDPPATPSDDDEPVTLTKAQHRELLARAEQAAGAAQAKTPDGASGDQQAQKPTPPPAPPGRPGKLTLDEMDAIYSDPEKLHEREQQMMQFLDHELGNKITSRLSEGLEAQSLGFHCMWRVFDQVPEMEEYPNLVMSAIQEAAKTGQHRSPISLTKAAIEICKRDVMAFGDFAKGRDVDARPSAKAPPAKGTTSGGRGGPSKTQIGGENVGGALSSRMLGL